MKLLQERETWSILDQALLSYPGSMCIRTLDYSGWEHEWTLLQNQNNFLKQMLPSAFFYFGDYILGWTKIIYCEYLRFRFRILKRDSDSTGCKWGPWVH